MKASAILSLVAVAGLACASPIKARHDSVEIVFLGAADAEFTQSFPADGSTVSISMSPSATLALHISRLF